MASKMGSNYLTQLPNEALMEASMTKSVSPRNRIHWYFPYNLVHRNYISFAMIIDFMICFDDEKDN